MDKEIKVMLASVAFVVLLALSALITVRDNVTRYEPTYDSEIENSIAEMDSLTLEFTKGLYIKDMFREEYAKETGITYTLVYDNDYEFKKWKRDNKERIDNIVIEFINE